MLFAAARILNSLEAGKKLVNLEREDPVLAGLRAEFAEPDSPIRRITYRRFVDERMLCVLKQSDRSPDMDQFAFRFTVPAHVCRR